MPGGPWARARAHGPISQARCPRPILIQIGPILIFILIYIYIYIYIPIESLTPICYAGCYIEKKTSTMIYVETAAFYSVLARGTPDFQTHGGGTPLRFINLNRHLTGQWGAYCKLMIPIVPLRGSIWCPRTPPGSPVMVGAKY